MLWDREITGFKVQSRYSLEQRFSSVGLHTWPDFGEIFTSLMQSKRKKGHDSEDFWCVFALSTKLNLSNIYNMDTFPF